MSTHPSTSAPTGSLLAMSALGEAWCGDWLLFDGRTLRSQLDEIADLIRAEVRGEDMKRALAGFYAANEICPSCRVWTEHCYCGRVAA